MDNRKDDQYYINQIKEHISYIEEQMQDKTQKDLETCVMLRNSILFSVEQIGEAAGKLTKEFTQKYDALPWKNMYGMRNIISHDYGSVRMDVVYDVVTNGILQIKDVFQIYGL